LALLLLAAFDFHFNANIFAVAFEDHASVFKGAAIQFVLCQSIACSAAEIFFDPVGQVALPFEIPCRRKRGSRFLCQFLLVFAFSSVHWHPVCTENLKSDHSGDEVRPGWRVN